jgi:hypothetical protein
MKPDRIPSFSEEKTMFTDKKRLVFSLGILQLFIGIGAIPAGLLLVIDPSGEMMSMPLDMLAGSPFPNFLVPGIFLLAVNGIGSIIGAVLTFRRHQWAGLVAMGLGAFLVTWIIIQVWVVKPPIHWLQAVYFVLGLVEIALGWRIGEGLKSIGR